MRHWSRSIRGTNRVTYIVVYSVDSLDSFEKAKQLHRDVRFCNASITEYWILVANKTDLPSDEWTVPHEMGQKLADQLGIPFVPTSAKTNHKIDQIFMKICSDIDKMHYNEYIKNEEKVTHKDDSCCYIL